MSMANGKISKSAWMIFSRRTIQSIGQKQTHSANEYLQDEKGQYLSAVASACRGGEFLALRRAVQISPNLHAQRGATRRIVTTPAPLKRAIVSRSQIVYYLYSFAPALTSSSFTSWWPLWEAPVNAVAPYSSFILASAPLASSNSTTSLWPTQEAAINAVPSSFVFILASAPLARSNSTTSLWPF